MRAIDADALKEEIDYYIREAGWGEAHNEALRWCLEFIDNQPTIGPERKTGKWIIRHPEQKNIFGGKTIECSECGTRLLVQYVEDEKYCRSCGIKMGGVKMEEGEQGWIN